MLRSKHRDYVGYLQYVEYRNGRETRIVIIYDGRRTDACFGPSMATTE